MGRIFTSDSNPFFAKNSEITKCHLDLIRGNLNVTSKKIIDRPAHQKANQVRQSTQKIGIDENALA